MFNAGAGVVGSYQECAWQTLGEGQFKPKDGSQPYIGEVNTLEKVKEFKVEIVCTGEYIEATVMALKSSHPYEVPAFSVIKLESF
ncbi:MAG: NGG1p interacting factor NIF3 [Thiotrichales bacterium]|nr:MAG: NGG1p interacting factor NIF3 [Thiotrichales bacterium]